MPHSTGVLTAIALFLVLPSSPGPTAAEVSSTEVHQLQLADRDSSQPKSAKSRWSPAKRMRLKVVGQQRRLIFNDDMYELDRTWAHTPEGLLRARLGPLVGTQVDTISFSVIEADAPVYDSKIQPIYGDAHGGPPPERAWPRIVANIKALRKSRHCPIQIITDFAHQHGIESWAHVRMNDVHDSFVPGWLCNWKKENPDLLVDRTGMLADRALYVTAADFTHPEVRGRKFEIIEEVGNRYDIDGYELDYIRHSVLFSRSMRGQPVTSEEVEIMTSFMRRVRQFTDQLGARRGRPVLIASRVPGTIEKCLNIGLDVKTWLEDDLVDILIGGGGYSPFTIRISDFTQLADP